MAVRFKQLSKTSTEWASLNPTLLEGEIGFEKDTKKIKVGDGITAWNNLDYVTGSSSDLDTSNLVDLTSDQTITGTKTVNKLLFSDDIELLKESGNAGIVIGSRTINYIPNGLVAIGINTDSFSATAQGQVIIGWLAKGGGISDIAIGTRATNNATNSSYGAVAVGAFANTYRECIAIGDNAIAGDESKPYSIAIGRKTEAKGNNAISIGAMSKSSGNSSIQLGYGESTGDSAIAVGYNASSQANNAIQLGEGTNINENTFNVWDYQILSKNTGKIPNERLNLGTKKYLHRITLNLSNQVSGTAPTKMAVIHLDYYSEQETAYTSPNFATIALANSIRCSGYYTDTDTSLTEKNFVYEIALPQSNEFVLNSSFSITIQSTGSSITDEVVGYIFS